MSIQRNGHRYIDTATGKTIDCWYPASNRSLPRGCLAEKSGLIRGELFSLAVDSLDAEPASTEDAYLRLHLLSERSVVPNRINLDGIFGLLPIVAWTSAGPVFAQHLDALRAAAAKEYHCLSVPSVDRFLRMTDYVVPSGMRIADADRVRLGDDCIVEAGLYVTAGAKVKLPDDCVVSARELSGKSGLLFRRNSQSGAVEVLPTNRERWGGLNTSLHANGCTYVIR